jgi:hypothetical protein
MKGNRMSDLRIRVTFDNGEQRISEHDVRHGQTVVEKLTEIEDELTDESGEPTFRLIEIINEPPRHQRTET